VSLARWFKWTPLLPQCPLSLTTPRRAFSFDCFWPSVLSRGSFRNVGTRLPDLSPSFPGVWRRFLHRGPSSRSSLRVSPRNENVRPSDSRYSSTLLLEALSPQCSRLLAAATGAHQGGPLQERGGGEALLASRSLWPSRSRVFCAFWIFVHYMFVINSPPPFE